MVKNTFRIFKIGLHDNHQRSIKAKKNIIISLGARLFDMLGSLLLVPLSLHYLGESEYGIWLTISSIIAWFGFLDIGLGNGMRNKFAQAVAKNEKEKAKIYVSTTYAAITIIMMIFITLFLVINHFINWSKILNAPKELTNQLSILSIIVFVTFAIRFIFQIIITIALADQKPSLLYIVNAISKLLVVSCVYIMFIINKKSIIIYGFIYTIIPIIVLLIFSTILYNRSYKYYRPSINNIDFSYVRSLMSLGGKFFFLQMSAIVLLMTDNIIITQLFSPDEVTKYQIANKYFGFILILYLVLLSPLWSAVTDSITKNDYDWIKKTINKYITISFFMSIIVLIMFIYSNDVYRIWLGYNINIPLLLSGLFSIYIILQMLSTLFTNFINGTGFLRISLYESAFTILFNIPLSIFFSKYVMHSASGVILATIISVLLSIILKVVQYYKIVNNHARGIWIK